MSAYFPDIMLPDVLDYLDAQQLMLSAMPVARYWRDAAIDHPVYWRNILLGSWYPDPPGYAGSQQLCILRLERSRNRPVSLSINWLEDTRPDAVFDAIARHLSHIQDLVFYGLLSTADHILSALCRSAAPLMKTLTLEFILDYARPVTILPRELFDGQASSLNRVSIRGLTLEPGHGFPPCLDTVRFLTIGYSTQHSVPPNRPLPNLFLHLRNLQELYIHGCVDLSDPAYHNPATWSVLPVLRLNMAFGQDGWDVLELPVGGVKRIVFSGDGLTVGAMMNMLGPRVSVAFDWRRRDQPSSSVHTRLRSVSDTSGRSRESEVLIPTYDPSYPHDAIAAYQHASIVSRIVQLGLALQNWNDLVGRGYLTRFPALEELVLVISYSPLEDGWWSPEASARLSCPRLNRLILRRQRSSQPPVIKTRNVIEFAAGSLAEVHFPIVLEVNEASLDGSLEDSRDLFSFVASSDTKEYEFND